MKINLKILMLILSINCFAQTSSIDGILISKFDSYPLPDVTIMIKGTEIGTLTNFDGYFKIDSLNAGKYDLEISLIGFGSDIIYGVETKENSITNLSLALPSKKCDGSTLKNCPVDNETKNVIPIIYGLPERKLIRKAEKGKVLLGGCVITGCDPVWYCKQHKKQF